MKKISLITFLFLVCNACGDDDNSGDDNFDRKSMLENIGSNIILPAHANFEEKSALLMGATEQLNEQISADELTNLQELWLNTAIAWKHVEMFNLGPVDQLGLKTSIDNWPSNTAAIENVIAATEAIDNSYIQSLGSSSKGIPAMEYLLFDPEQGNTAVLKQLNQSPRRIAFLKALSANLHKIAVTVYEGWKPDRGNYLKEFIESTRTDAGSATNMLANQFIGLIEFMKNSKIGIPLGKKSGGVILENNVEARPSGSSLILLVNNVASVEDVFMGSPSEDNGFYHYLLYVNAQTDGQQLADVIRKQISKVNEAVSDINMPLHQALLEQPEQVEQLYKELQWLVILTKADMMSALGLLVTYSDNDGD